MKPHTFEYALENNPLRAWVRETMEVKPMRAATDVTGIDHALHIACGDGSATQMILKHFSPRKMSGVDQDGDLIATACRRHQSDTVDFSVQDTRSLSFADDLFDAAFDLGDLHNFQDWRHRVVELKRVLKPGGLLILEEISQETFSHAAGRLFKALTDHPYDCMLTMEGLRDHALQSGFEILHFEQKNPLGLLRYFVMVARKPAFPRGSTAESSLTDTGSAQSGSKEAQ